VTEKSVSSRSCPGITCPGSFFAGSGVLIFTMSHIGGQDTPLSFIRPLGSFVPGGLLFRLPWHPDLFCTNPQVTIQGFLGIDCWHQAWGLSPGRLRHPLNGYRCRRGSEYTAFLDRRAEQKSCMETLDFLGARGRTRTASLRCRYNCIIFISLTEVPAIVPAFFFA